jgi:hypothetical protein
MNVNHPQASHKSGSREPGRRDTLTRDRDNLGELAPDAAAMPDLARRGRTAVIDPLSGDGMVVPAGTPPGGGRRACTSTDPRFKSHMARSGPMLSGLILALQR